MRKSRPPTVSGGLPTVSGGPATTGRRERGERWGVKASSLAVSVVRNTARPSSVRVSSAMLALNVALNLLFIKIFAMDADGLVLGTAVTSWAGLLALLPGLSRKLTLPRGTHAFASPVARMFIASLASGALAYGTERVTRDAVGATLALGVAIGVGVASYFVAAALLRVPEVRDVRDRLARIKGRAGD